MSGLIDNSIAAMAKLREIRPRVHCITNTVAQHFSANVLLACGAIPSMSVSEEEIEDFVASASSLLINLGTMDPLRTRVVHKAVAAAKECAIPFVLDPVFVNASPVRLGLAKQILAARPKIIRANQAEAAALFDCTERGDNEFQAMMCSHTDCAVITGATDKVFTANKLIQIQNGAPVMTRLTAMGCALTALMAALLAVENDAGIAATAALLWFNIAGEVAAEKSSGPGTFVPQFIDTLAALDANTISERAKL